MYENYQADDIGKKVNNIKSYKPIRNYRIDNAHIHHQPIKACCNSGLYKFKYVLNTMPRVWV